MGLSWQLARLQQAELCCALLVKQRERRVGSRVIGSMHVDIVQGSHTPA